MPSSPNYVRDYEQEARTESPARKRQRIMRIRARRQMAKKRHIPKGYDVNHIKPLSKGGSNSRANLNLRKASRNRSYRRTSSGAMAAGY